MTDEPDALESSLDAFTSSVETSLYVVTTADPDGEMAGCLVGFATQCSMVPPRFLVCLSMENHTYRVAARSNCLGVHLLGEEQTELASLFAEQTGDSIDKFRRCHWHRGETGAPILDESAAWFEGHVLERVDLGDHQGNLIRPVDAGGRRARVMTYQRSPALRPGHPIPE
jgi:flavin reductase (DIM6/NTAB) family NADH-FMN oxidoreductase RutF